MQHVEIAVMTHFKASNIGTKRVEPETPLQAGVSWNPPTTVKGRTQVEEGKGVR